MAIQTSPNMSENQQSELQEGFIVGSDDVLSLDIDDNEVARVIGNRIENGRAWWNKELKLDDNRKKVEEYYLNRPFDEKDLYEHQVPYKNNRIFIDIETLLPLITMQPAQPLVTEGSDSDESRQLASDLQNSLTALYEDLYIKAEITVAMRHLLMGKRIGILKCRLDMAKGKMLPDGTRKGGIIVEAVRPETIVVFEGTQNGKSIRGIAQLLEATVEELVSKFTDKKEDIFRELNISRGVRTQMQKLIGYYEVWFTYYDKQNNPVEAVAWKLGKVVLDKMKNPNWNYGGYKTDPVTGKQVNLNFLDAPEKPYIFFTHTNLGKYIYDDTSLTEQAIPQQDILNKRGRQIVENADQATSGLVLNSNMISQEDGAKIVGDPSEKLFVEGDVRSAAARLPYNPLPAYVTEDKMLARSEIDDIFGTNAALKGEAGNKTLGQDIMSQRANMGRMQPLADTVEDGMDRLYKYLVQMMKVYWDEDEKLSFVNADGKTQFVNMGANKIEEGIKVRVKSGSALPKDKFAIKNETIQALPILDPLSIAEGLDKPNPKEWAKRIVYYRFFMDKYLTEVLGENGQSGMDNQALADIQALLNGQQPPVPETPSKEYISTFEQFMSGQGFQGIQDPNIKAGVVAFAKQVQAKAQAGIGEAPQAQQQAPTENLGVPTPVPASTPVPSSPAPLINASGSGIINTIKSLFAKKK